jgi:hypothetical protein
MAHTKPNRILSVLLTAALVYCVLLESRSAYAAASAINAIRITSPAAGEVLADWKALVRGELKTPAGTEVGVKVNGVVALVSRGKFATMLPLNFPTPTNDIAAIVTNSSGAILATHSIHVAAESPNPDPILMFRASVVLGMAPLPVRFTMTSRKQIARVELDLDGDGAIDWQGATLDKQEFSLSEAGLYFPTVRVIDTDGNAHTESALVQVFDPKELDGLLQAKWTAMKGALRQGDIGRAVDYIVTRKRDGYRKMFESLTIPLSDIDQVLTDIKFVKLAGIRAEYNMLYKDRNTGTLLSGLVNFSLDTDGIWRVDFFNPPTAKSQSVVNASASGS